MHYYLWNAIAALLHKNIGTLCQIIITLCQSPLRGVNLSLPRSNRYYVMSKAR